MSAADACLCTPSALMAAIRDRRTDRRQRLNSLKLFFIGRKRLAYMLPGDVSFQLGNRYPVRSSAGGVTGHRTEILRYPILGHASGGRRRRWAESGTSMHRGTCMRSQVEFEAIHTLYFDIWRAWEPLWHRRTLHGNNYGVDSVFSAAF